MRSVPFTARLICATNANLTDLIAQSRFRRDLYFRINVIPVEIPPLRTREVDIIPLLRHYVSYFASTFGSDVRGVTTQAEAVAGVHDWPGNVRELRNRAERAVALAAGPWVSACDLFPDCAQSDEPEADIRLLSAVRDDAERRHIVAVLERTGGQVKKAADLLGISRTTIWEKMRRLGLQSDDRNDGVDES